MKKLIPALLIAGFVLPNLATAQCTTGQSKIKVVLKTDDFPNETNWTVTDNNNNIILQSQAGMAQNTIYMDSVCVPDNICHQFKITDQGWDGICCMGGHGYYEVYYNGTLVKKDSTFGSQSTAYLGCSAGSNCGTALSISQGFHTAPGPNTWYQFVAPNTGMYVVSTCNLGNSCDTKLWMYDYCNNLQPTNTNTATIYYATNNCNGLEALINAYLVANHTYYIRVGDENNSCASTAINWEINYNGSVSGCLDTQACNFNPFATISDPTSCLYYPDAQCPTGSDLKVDSQRLATTIMMDIQPSPDQCMIREGCMNGYGQRELVRFDTKINNIGQTDFYAGPPPSSPLAYSPIFEWDQCHGHWHFENYAEYLLADMQNNFVPIGYKNGFCVIDLTCSTGSPKFGCNNMGITAGCADIYSSGLDCQWIDITDVPDGDYKLILRVNWVPRPDFYGRYETSYFNNWAKVCITLSHNTAGQRQVTLQPNCAPYIDCMGVENGLAVKDCNGDCNGTRLTGDVNTDGLRNTADVTNYLVGAINHTLPATKCNDLNNDQQINVVDAALLFDCAKHGPGTIPSGHSHEPCRFPDLVKNPTQHADFSLGNIDYLAKTIDIFIKNTDAKVLGYQLKLKGLTLSAVQNAITGFTPTIHFKPSGEIIVLTSDEIPIQKNTVTTALLRLQFSTIDSNKVCIDSVVAVVNEAFEEIQHNIVDSICVTAIPTPNRVPNVLNNKGHELFPNPFTHTTTLMLNNNASFTAVIYDMLGRAVRVYDKQVGKVLLIEKGSLNAGIYTLEVKSTGWQFREKLMIE